MGLLLALGCSTLPGGSPDDQASGDGDGDSCDAGCAPSQSCVEGDCVDGSGTGGAQGSGGTGSGGFASGGAGTGGASTGGIGSGGVGTGGSGTGGAFSVPFILGADISSVQEGNASFRDTDGVTKSIFALLKNHGFNYIRVKSFVDPDAEYGYSSQENGCNGFSEPYGDRDHVVAFGKQIKDAGMGFLLDLHYSDVWADPGNQIIPEAWRGAKDIATLAKFVRDYTVDVVATAVAAGARPDMVQVGNEITPGMLMHVPGNNTDCWGNNPAAAPFGGQASTGNWSNLATLLKAGIEGVRSVDPTIQIMLHTENTSNLSGVRWWLDNALAQGVDFDVFGLSCYTAFQGQPSVWQTTFDALVSDPDYNGIDFVIAEYNPARTEANLMMKNLAGGRGLGTFFWEPTRSGEWGSAMFTWQGNTLVANSADFQEYDNMRSQLGL